MPRRFTRAVRVAEILGAVAAVVVLAILFVPRLATGGNAATPGIEQPDLNVAVVPAVDSAGFFVALHQGLFTAHGLHVTFVPAVSSATVISAQALARPRNRIDISCGNYVSYIQAQENYGQGKRPSSASSAMVAADLDIFAEGSVMDPGAQGLYVMPGSRIRTLAGEGQRKVVGRPAGGELVRGLEPADDHSVEALVVALGAREEPRAEGAFEAHYPMPRALAPQTELVGVAQVEEARAEPLVVRADQRVAEQVDVVGDDHDLAGLVVHVDGAGRVGEDEDLDPETSQHAHGKDDLVEPIALVVVHTARHDGHRHRAAVAEHELAAMPGRGRGGEVRHLGVGDAGGALEGRGERAQAGAQHHPDGRTEWSAPPDERRRLLRLLEADHSRRPAMQALTKLARVPATRARTPRRARSFRRSGASTPMPPIWMPMEPMLAKPQSA